MFLFLVSQFIFWYLMFQLTGLPRRRSGKESAYEAGDVVQSLGQEDPLEREMATHSNNLVCEFPWTE